MPPKNVPSKRKREKQPVNPSAFETSLQQIEKRKSRTSNLAPLSEETSGEDLNITLTRRRAQTIGEEPLHGEQEPEQLLRQKFRKQIHSEMNDRDQSMDRQPGSGRTRLVSLAALCQRNYKLHVECFLVFLSKIHLPMHTFWWSCCRVTPTILKKVAMQRKLSIL